VCFWYIPPSLRGRPPGPDRDARLHQVRTISGSSGGPSVHWRRKDVLTLRFSAGGSSDQRQDDGEGLRHDWLSAFGRQSQFLQMRVLKSRNTARGH